MTPLNSSVDISSCLSYASKRTTLTCVSEMRHRPPPRHSWIRHYAGAIVMGFTFGTFLLEWAFLSFLSYPHQKSKERERDFYTFSPSLFLLHSQVSISLFSPIFFFPFFYSKLSFVLKLDLVEQSSLFFAHFQARYFFFSFHVVVIVHCVMGKKIVKLQILRDVSFVVHQCEQIGEIRRTASNKHSIFVSYLS